VLLKNLTIAEAFSLLSRASASSSEISFVKRTSFVKIAKDINFVKTAKDPSDGRVRSTARVTHEGEETEATEIAPISKVMRQSGLVVTEGTIDEGTSG
jgi:acyl-coenzyme A thioesterase PaaI-like protein